MGFARKATAAVFGLGLMAAPALAADILDPTPMAGQAGAVDGINFNFSGLGGVLDDAGSAMFLASAAMPMPFVSSLGIQADLAAGNYDGRLTSAAAALHIFWRDPATGMIGIYGDWGYISPVHSGRLGAEAAYYSGPWSVDIFAGMEFGQNVYTKFVDEVDFSYYFDENTRGSIGHRFTARGNVGNLAFEKQFGAWHGGAWSVFGEAEAGEDSFYQVFVGIRAYMGSSSSTTLQQRDRHDGVKVRVPRNLASISQCGPVDNPFPAPSWLTGLHLIAPGSMTETLCASRRSINRVSSVGPTGP